MKTKLIIAAIFACIIAGMFIYIFKQPVVIDTSSQIIELNNKEKEKAIQLADNYKKQSEELEKKLAESVKEKGPLKAEIARLKATLARAEALPVPTGDLSQAEDTAGTPDGLVLVRDQIIVKQDELIKKLEFDFSLSQEQNKLLKLENGQLHIALSESQKNESIYRIQKEAQIAAIKSARWRGRTEGFSAAAVLDIGLRLANVF